MGYSRFKQKLFLHHGDTQSAFGYIPLILLCPAAPSGVVPVI